MPNLISGDFDSIEPESEEFFKESNVRLEPTPDQDSTDLTKLLRLVCGMSIEFGSIIVLGGIGGRFDHTLASLNSVLTIRQWTDKPVFLLDSENAVTIAFAGSTKFDLSGLSEVIPKVCGVVPFVQRETRVTTKGLRWNLTDTVMEFGGIVSTSNELVFDGSSCLEVTTNAPLIVTFHAGWKWFPFSHNTQMSQVDPPIQVLGEGDQVMLDSLETAMNAARASGRATQISADEPPSKRSKPGRTLKVAVAGCSHGEMEMIYRTLEKMEMNRGYKFDLLICCGDYQAIRNKADLQTIKVSPRFRRMGTFHAYYSGERVAPVFTIFIGGNHESAGFLAELPNGGWIAPNIYYMGYSSVVRFAGLRIGGLSGIYKAEDYDRSHFERPPFSIPTMISAYHVRSIDVFRLKLLANQSTETVTNELDIMITHDWPVGITDYGDTETLLKYKSFFRDDIKHGKLGNPKTTEILNKVRPCHWFAAHLHCRYQAYVNHYSGPDGVDPSGTVFLALDKPEVQRRDYKRRFLEAIEIPIPDDAELSFEYDPKWLAILRKTDHLVLVDPGVQYMPHPDKYYPNEEDLKIIEDIYEGDYTIPHNFGLTAPPFDPEESDKEPCLYYINPQTTKFCHKLQIRNMNKMMYERDGRCLGTPHCELSARANADNTEEIELGDDDDFFVIDDGTAEAVAASNNQP